MRRDLQDETIDEQPIEDRPTEHRSLAVTQDIPAPDSAVADTIASENDLETRPTVVARGAGVRDTQFGDYEIVREIARGGMGAVFAAKHLQIGRIVALKVIRGSNPDAKELDRFQAEATAAGKLDHPGIVPPEQASGDRERIDHRCDVYSLGAVLYACLTGRPPFQGSTAVATVMQVLKDDVVSPKLLNAEVPKDLETICMKCLSKDPDRRYQSAIELRDDLNRYLNGEPIQARPVSQFERVIKWVRRNPRSVLTCLTAICTLIGAGIAIQTSLSSWRLNSRLANTHLQKSALEKSRQSLERDDGIVMRPLGQDTDLALRLAVTDMALAQNDLARAFASIESVPASEQTGFEYQLMRRRLHKHQREIDFGIGSHILGLDYINKELMVNAHYVKGQVVFLDPKTLNVNASSLILRPSKQADFDGNTWAFSNWEGSVTVNKRIKDTPPVEPRDLCETTPYRFMRVDESGQQVISVPMENQAGKAQIHNLDNGSLQADFDVGFRVGDVSIDRNRRLLYLSGASRESKPKLCFAAYSLDDWSKPVREIKIADKQTARKIEISHDGKSLLLFDNGYWLHRYSADDFSLKKTLGHAKSEILDMCFAPHDNSIAFCDRIGQVYLIEFRGEVRRFLINAHAGPCRSVCFGPSGNLIYSAGRGDGKVKEWNVNAIKQDARVLTMTGAVQRVAYSEDGRWIAVSDNEPGDRSTGAVLIDRNTGGVVDFADQIKDAQKQKQRGYVVWTGFANAGEITILVFRNGNVQWRESETGTLIHSVQLSAVVDDRKLVALSPDRQWLVVANGKSGTIYPVDTQKRVAAKPRRIAEELDAIAFAESNDLIAAMGRQSSKREHLLLTNIHTGEQDVIARANRSHFYLLAGSPKGNRFAFGGYEGQVLLVDTENSSRDWILDIGGQQIVDLRFSADGRRLFCCVRSMGVIVLDTQSGATTLQLTDKHAEMACLSANNDELAIVSSKKVRRFSAKAFPVPPKTFSEPVIRNLGDPTKNRPLN